MRPSSKLFSFAGIFRGFPSERMEKPNIFIMKENLENTKMDSLGNMILLFLRKDFDLETFQLSPENIHAVCPEFGSSGKKLQCIAIDSGQTEKIRDKIKEAIWSYASEFKIKRKLQEIILCNETANLEIVRLSDYGIFIPYKETEYEKIRVHTFTHSPFLYRYRTAIEKYKYLPQNLSDFLSLMFTDCPNHLFQKTKFRCSRLNSNDFNVKIKLNHCYQHELIKFAKSSLHFKKFRSRHENLQMFLLLNDHYTVASEVPLWLEPGEISNYYELFLTKDVLTGHIDILRYEKDGRIGIWDYKPSTKNEQNAEIQVFFYALMLSVRTGICLKRIICGYFDETEAFYFEPTQIDSFNGFSFH